MLYTLDSLAKLKEESLLELSHINGNDQAEAFRIKYLGKKGILRDVLASLKDVAPEDRKTFGAKANEIKTLLENGFENGFWKQTGKQTVDTSFDPTLPGYPFAHGTLHPLMTIYSQICEIFVSMGFDIADGPEVETDYYNFEALNFPKHHPARDMQDTFFISPDVVLRTHTSPVQIRVMEKQKPPIRSIMPGRVYRNEQISSRSFCMFHQIEGLFIDKNVSFADLKGTLLAFCQRLFDPSTRIKIRPSFFPFTEPSVEVDVECFLCKGKGCGMCKKSGWLEILGAGMVHPNVLKSGNIDSEVYSGFAFGMGIDRVTLLKYGIDDIRLLFENDLRFLRQF